MKFNENQLQNLRQNVMLRLSEHRFLHTVGVVAAAERIASYFPSLEVTEIAAAALLHDVTKELSVPEHCQLAEEFLEPFSAEEIESEAILHSLSAPYMVMRDFKEFATPDILSALKNHTTAEAGISLFDEVIYIADYVEDGRRYPACIRVREMLYQGMTLAQSESECLLAMHKAVLESLENTKNKLLFQGRVVNERTNRAIEYFSSLVKQMEN